MNNSEPMVEIKNLGLCMNGVWIHQNLNLTVLKGEILAIVGGSGCGKTALLRQILQLQKPTQGTISIFGIDILAADEKQCNDIRKNWGVVFQQGALFTSLTALEN